MIELSDLTKKFDTFTAVDHLNLRIETGEFFGLLGPNRSRKDYNDQSDVHPASAYGRRDPGRRGSAFTEKSRTETKNQCDYPGVFHASGHDDG